MEIQDELTYKIIGCAMTVHKTLGMDCRKLFIKRSLAIEMDHEGIEFGRK